MALLIISIENKHQLLPDILTNFNFDEQILIGLNFNCSSLLENGRWCVEVEMEKETGRDTVKTENHFLFGSLKLEK